MTMKMSHFERLFFIEPYLWLQCCFFQPVRFKHDFEIRSVPQRLIMMLRLTPVLFIYAYTPALLIRISVFLFRPDLFPQYVIPTFTPLNPSVGLFLFDATWATAVSCLLGALIAGIFSVRLGIAVALALGLASGIIVNTGDDTFVGIIFGITFGLALGIAFNSAHALKEGGLENVTIASALGILGGLAMGFLTGTIGGYWAGYAVGILYPSLLDTFIIAGSFAGLAVGGIGACLLSALLGEIFRKTLKSKSQAVATGIKISIAVATAFGLVLGIPVGDRGFNADTFANGLLAGGVESLIFGSGFLLLYLVSYYRLPLYPLSAYSTVQAYFASRRQPQHALYHVRHSSLHWDECVFLQLPYLKKMLQLAAQENLDETLVEIDFIVLERPQQSWAAQAAAYDLALLELERRTTLRDIGLAHTQLVILLPPHVRTLNMHADAVFRALDDASREAASYSAHADKQARQEALERMLKALQAIHHYKTFRDAELNTHLKTVISQWSISSEQARETLQSVSGRLYIENPYITGRPLDRGDSLFFGRDDIIQKLGQALQQQNRPTFLLTGERRMGKSSILKQLPVLLGSRYIPVFYDLQSPNMIASIAAFFATIVAGIERQLTDRGLPVEVLDRSLLEQAQKQDELEVYALFDRWYTTLDQTLEQNNCTLVLMFDEFDKLEDAEERGTINLHLLFSWFRSVIQNRPHLALLFSGARMGGDMGRSWAGYFVNVELIKISFLREKDAHDLIVLPISHIFNEAVAEEIIRITHGHPFLIQAICKRIIEILNDDASDQATIENVEDAKEGVFESWAGYFWDLWDRNDQDQRACLLALLTIQPASVDQIIEQRNLDKQATLFALEKLRTRDLVIRKGGVYQIAIPLFALWMEQNHDLLSF